MALLGNLLGTVDGLLGTATGALSGSASIRFRCTSASSASPRSMAMMHTTARSRRWACIIFDGGGGHHDAVQRGDDQADRGPSG